MKKLALLIVTIILLSVTLSASNEIKEAVVSPVPILLNGEKVQIGTYLIEQEHYFKLRDLAALLKDTDFKFNIGYDKESQSVIIESNKDYNPTDKDLKPLAEGVQKAIISPLSIIVNDNKVDIKAYLINKNNYVKLRDFSELIGFYVGWNKETKSVEIRTIDLEEKSDNTTVNSNIKPVEVVADIIDKGNGSTIINHTTADNILSIMESLRLPFTFLDIKTPENQKIIEDSGFDPNDSFIKINDKPYTVNYATAEPIIKILFDYFHVSGQELTTDMPEKFIATTEDAKEQVKEFEDKCKRNRALRKENKHFRMDDGKVIPHDDYTGVLVFTDEMVSALNLTQINECKLNSIIPTTDILDNITVVLPLNKPYTSGNLLDFLNPNDTPVGIYKDNLLFYDRNIGYWYEVPHSLISYYFSDENYFTDNSVGSDLVPQYTLTANIDVYSKILSSKINKPTPLNLNYIMSMFGQINIPIKIVFK